MAEMAATPSNRAKHEESLGLGFNHHLTSAKLPNRPKVTVTLPSKSRAHEELVAIEKIHGRYSVCQDLVVDQHLSEAAHKSERRRHNSERLFGYLDMACSMACFYTSPAPRKLSAVKRHSC